MVNPKPVLLASLLAAPLLAGACERKAEPPTAEVELERRRESLMEQMDAIAAEHPEEAAPADDPAPAPDPSQPAPTPPADPLPADPPPASPPPPGR